MSALAALLAVAALSGGLPVFPLTLAIVGLTVAPVTSISYSLIDRAAPPGTATEATTWMVLGNGVGGAEGASLAGIAVEEAGVTLAILVASAGALGSGLVVLARYGTLGCRGRLPRTSSSRPSGPADHAIATCSGNLRRAAIP